VGDGGTGRLLILDGGLVAVEGTLTIGGSGDSAIYMGDYGTLTLPGYLDQSLDDFLDAVAGTDAIRYWDDVTGGWSNITNATRDVDYTLEYIAMGVEDFEDSEGFTALTFIKKPIVTVSTRALGDANGDYRVDELDAKLMAANWGQSGDWLDGDVNGDGKVNAVDATIIAAQWGQDLLDPQTNEFSKTGIQPITVPEPSVLVVLLIGAAMLLVRRKR